MRDGTRTQCGQASVHSKPWGILGGDLLDGKKVEHTDYLCVNCDAFEQYFTDPEALPYCHRQPIVETRRHSAASRRPSAQRADEPPPSSGRVDPTARITRYAGLISPGR
jgi:hypothetical protein